MRFGLGERGVGMLLGRGEGEGEVGVSGAERWGGVVGVSEGREEFRMGSVQ